MIQDGKAWVGVNTHLANRIVWEAFENQIIPSWLAFDSGQREVKISDNSRIDMVLWNSKDEKLKHFVEVKNVTMAENGVAYFPDSETTRGQKHLKELAAISRRGQSAEMFFLVQRSDCQRFSPAKEIDPEYSRLLAGAREAGVVIQAFPCELSKNGVRLLPHPLDIQL